MSNTSRHSICITLLLCLISSLGAEQLSSPTWGFSIELPEGYLLTGGDNKDRFGFTEEVSGASVDLAAYPAGRFASPEALARDTLKRLKAVGEASTFDYRGRKAALFRISFRNGQETENGWGLAVELGMTGEGKTTGRPLLLALAYGTAEAELLNLSSLDSIAPEAPDRNRPGPVSVYSYPATGRLERAPAGLSLKAVLDKSDQEASEAVVDRESRLLARYSDSPYANKAWARFYRVIYRDAKSRLEDIAFSIERELGTPEGTREAQKRAFAEKALAWVQGFKYERDREGNDFINPVTAALEGRGDCDTRALLLALVLEQNNIGAAMMVSREYEHAMALVDIEGDGGRFPLSEKKWLVAETTAKVALGKIDKATSELSKWMGVDLR